MISVTLIMMFKAHTKHIKKNTYHYKYIEFLISC